MATPLFDSVRFLDSLAGDPELGRELLAAFLDDSPVRSAALEQALQAGDASQASKLAHSLKGMCGVVRASALVNAALGMEQIAGQGDVDGARELFSGFAEDMTRLQQEIREFMNTL